MINSTVIIKTKRLILREVKKSDLNDLFNDMNNIKISSFMLGIPFPFKKSDANQWINHCIKSSKKVPREEYVFAITVRNEDKLIGEVILNENDFDNKSVELAFWLSESQWNKGIVTEAVESVMDFAFNKLKINRLEMSAFVENVGSNAIAKKLGFKYEGRKREASIPESTKKVHDDNLYSMLRREYRK